jgi:ferritin-like metal-binding protein YciE
MADMTDPRDLLLHELGDILYVEQALVKTLPKLAKEATDAALSSGFEVHLAETKQHVQRVKKAFALLGADVKAEQCPGFDGIKQEHDEFVSQQSPAPGVLDAFLTGAGARTEHYEIAAYEGMITIARGLGERGIAQLLAQNLSEEKAALTKLKTVANRLAGPGAPAVRAA